MEKQSLKRREIQKILTNIIVQVVVLLRSVQHRRHEGRLCKVEDLFGFRFIHCCGVCNSINFYLNQQSSIQLYQQQSKMFRTLTRLQPLSIIKPEKARHWNGRISRYLLVPAIFSSSIYYYKMKEISVIEDSGDQEFVLPENQQGAISKFTSRLLRFLELGLIFTPSILLLPLCLFQSTKKYWLGVLLWGVKRAGFVWIKAFQYLSHRRDIIGEDMAELFVVLREKSPEHALKKTQQTIRRMYGKQINEMFEEFDRTPIASGSVSQVYKATLHGKVVAVKVRHPNIGKNLNTDIDLLFMFSKFFSIFSKKFEIPITTHSLKKILAEQLYFLQEKRNIDNFNKIDVDKDVSFPKTFQESTDQVLIEEYIDGKTIGFYETHTHNMNKLIASIGAKAFFSMLMKYNFVHADCHAGNILVRIKQAPNEITNYFNNVKSLITNFLIAQVIKFGFKSQFLKRLSQQHYEYEKSVTQLIETYKSKVQIILIDVGMAIKLTKEKKDSFQSFLSEIIQGNSLECAKWIFKISKYDGKLLIEGQKKKYLTDLEIMFERVHKTSLQSLEGIVVLKEMLEVIRSHDMKIDGEISILLTNMLILQSIAKDLDPSINILRCAVPYLQYK